MLRVFEVYLHPQPARDLLAKSRADLSQPATMDLVRSRGRGRFSPVADQEDGINLIRVSPFYASDWRLPTIYRHSPKVGWLR